MTDIDVRRWHTRYRVSRPQQAERVAAWNAGLAQVDLPAALRPEMGDEEWICVRRLHLALRLREDDGAVQACEAWSASLAAQLLRELREGGGDNVVRYRDRREALADFLYRASAGDLRRAWAWRRMGWLRPGDSDGGGFTRRAVLASAVDALAAEPAWIWPLLNRLVRADAATGAWTTLVCALEEADWDALLAASPRTRDLHALLHRVLESPAVAQADACGASGESLSAWIARHPQLARRRERVLAVLLAAQQAIGSASEAQAAQRLAAALAQVRSVARAAHGALREVLERAPSTSSARDIVADRMAETEVASAPSRDPAAKPRAGLPRAATEGGDTSSRAELAPAPPLPECTESLATQWAGLLFLLNLVGEVGVVEAACDALPRVLWNLAVVHLGVPAGDPAVRAFCGGWEPRSPPELDAGLEGACTRAAIAIRHLLDARIGRAPEGEEDRVRFVCHRPGMLRFEPGWIELAMGAGSADARLRRAALDLDPGWLAWLGCVVRFRYE